MGNRQKSKGILALTASAAVWLSAPSGSNASEATILLGLAIGGTHSPFITAIGGTHEPVVTAIGGTHDPVTTAIGGTHEPVVTAIGGTHDPVTTAIGGTHEPVVTAIGGTHDPVKAAIGGTHEPVASAVPGGLVVDLVSVIEEIKPSKGEIRLLGQTVKFDVTDDFLLSKVAHAAAGANARFVLLVDQKLTTITLIDFEETGGSYVSGSTRVGLIGFVSEPFPLIGKALVGQQLIDYSSALSNTPNVRLERGQFIMISGTQPLPKGEFFANQISAP